jgi:hypothetical protein
MAPELGTDSGGSRWGASISPRQRWRRSRPGAGVHVVQPRVLHMDPAPGPLQCTSPTRRDTHLRIRMSRDWTPHLARPATLLRAPRVPVPPGTHREPRTLTVRISLTVHQNTSLLADRYGPHLCKAVLDLLREPAPNQEMPSPGGQISGMAMASHKNCCDWSGGSGRGIPSISRRATTRQPGGRARRRTH